MQLLHKPDWAETKARYRCWWERRDFGRCGLWVTAPRDGVAAEPAPAAPAEPLDRWTDLDFWVAVNDYSHRHTWFGGEAFPVWHPGYPGHVSIPTFLGCHVELDEHTGWWEPILLDEDFDATLLDLDREGYWWRFGEELRRVEAAAALGRSIPSIGALGGGGDTLAAVRGTLRLLVDVLDRPERVRQAERWLMDLWFATWDEFYAPLREASDGGSANWFPLWAPGRFYPAQNDFSYNISPATFRELFLPEIRRQTEWLDHTVYHVDGVNAFAHVPALCELPRLQCLQILPGAGKPSPLHYADVLRYVLAQGKNVHISIGPEEVEPALRMLPHRGLFIATHAASEAAGRDLLAAAERLYRP